MLNKSKNKVYKDEFRVFVRVFAERCIVVDMINFSNAISKNKELLTDGCVKDRNEPVKGQMITVENVIESS